MATFSTGFAGTENPLSEAGAWTSGPGTFADLQKTSGLCHAVGTGTCGARLLAPTLTAAQYAQARIATHVASRDAAVCARIASTTDADCYMFLADTFASPNEYRFFRVSDTGSLSFTLLGSGTGQAAVDEDVVRIEAVGGVIEGFVNGVSLGTRSDATYSSGQPGLYIEGGTFDWDDFEAGDYPIPYVVGAGTASFTATNGANLTPGLPTGWAADDIHVLLAARSDNTAMTDLSGSGWTQLSAGNNTAAQRVEVWARRAVGGDTAPTVTFGSGTVVRGARIVGIRGVDTGIALSSLQLSRSDNAASATITFATLTPTPANTRLLALYAYEDDPTAASTITNWSAFTISTSSLGNDMALGYADRSWPTASSATGGLTSTASGGTFANSVNTGILLDLPPPTSGTTRSVAGSEPAASGTLSRILAALRTVAGAQPSGTATLARRLGGLRALAGAQPAPSGTLSRVYGALRAVDGAQPSGSGALAYLRGYARTLAGSQPAGTGTLARTLAALRTLIGAQDAPAGTLARLAATSRILAGAQDAPSGTLARVLGAARALAGAQPGGSGTLTAQSIVSRTVAGTQPSATGTLTRVYGALRAVAGAQSAPSGTLSRLLAAARTLAGSQPAPTGTLTRSKANARAVAGAQPAPVGSLENLFTTTRLLAGSQPAAVGSLTRSAVLSRALDGAQPAASGTLIRAGSFVRSLDGIQGAPGGVLSVIIGTPEPGAVVAGYVAVGGVVVGYVVIGGVTAGTAPVGGVLVGTAP